MCDILSAVDEGAQRPTQIMQRANLTWLTLSINVEKLERALLLTDDAEGRCHSYRLTEKGGVALAQYRKLKQALPSHITSPDY